MSNEAIPRDLDGRRPGSWRWFSSQMTLWWGPVRPERESTGGGVMEGELTSTTVHFPRALGTPAASCQPPLFAFACSFHLYLLPHYLLLIVSSWRERSLLLSVCLVFFLSPLLSYRFYFILLLFSPPFSPRETETERNRRTRGFSPGNRFGASLSRAWVFGDRTRGISASLASFIPPETSTAKAIADALSWENILSKFLKIKFHSKSKVGQPNSPLRIIE